MAFTPPQDQPHVAIEGWRLWLGRIVFFPLTAMSIGMIFALYRAWVSGEITTVSRGYRASSRVYYFADNPVMFLVAFAFVTLLAGAIIFVNVLVAKRFFKRTRPG